MLDSIMDGLKGQLTSTIAEKTGLDLGQAEQAVPVAKDSISEGITSAISGGNVSGILGMLQGAAGGDAAGLVQNTVYKGIAGNFINGLVSKLGIPESMASTVSSVALPFIMSKIGNQAKAEGDTDDIDQSSVMSALGLDAGGLLGKAGDLLGGGGGGLGGMFK